ncbi:hypothetical protein [Anditalea andensis]|uniref:Cold-shock protein n=1 Tax=Anditalea andensis TaxID=1048983 RepID=A0A074L0H5_9BACT|nr:hypothetical protein [Anditalea andensis]KEO73985.1 hypothetical protein EL17_07480 [Anditalea andensis]
MGRSNNSFIKKQKADKKAKKRKEKFENRLERKGQESSGKLEDMIAYVDEFGNISDTPPEEPKPVSKDDKSKAPRREAHVKGDERTLRTAARPTPTSREGGARERDARDTRENRPSRDSDSRRNSDKD